MTPRSRRTKGGGEEGVPSSTQWVCGRSGHHSRLGGLHPSSPKPNQAEGARTCPFGTGGTPARTRQHRSDTREKKRHRKVKFGNLSVSSVTSSVTVCIFLAVLWSSLWNAQQWRTRFTRRAPCVGLFQMVLVRKCQPANTSTHPSFSTSASSMGLTATAHLAQRKALCKFHK